MEDLKDRVKKARQSSGYREELGEKPVVRGSVVVAADENYYAKIPQELLRDPKISEGARLHFGMLHSYCQKKQKAYDPATFVGQERLARDHGCERHAVSRRQRELEKAGWIMVERRGLNRPNLITLYFKKRRVR